jgi:hypothetical protein
VSKRREPPNKGMTKLSAAWLPGWTCRLMPAPPRSDAGTASQLIPGVSPALDAPLRGERMGHGTPRDRSGCLVARGAARAS